MDGAARDIGEVNPVGLDIDRHALDQRAPQIDAGSPFGLAHRAGIARESRIESGVAVRLAGAHGGVGFVQTGQIKGHAGCRIAFQRVKDEILIVGRQADLGESEQIGRVRRFERQRCLDGPPGPFSIPGAQGAAVATDQRGGCILQGKGGVFILSGRRSGRKRQCASGRSQKMVTHGYSPILIPSAGSLAGRATECD